MISSRTISIALMCAGLLLPAAAQAGPKLLFDPADGKVLYAEDIDDQWYPASLTKMMTAYVVFEALKAGQITLETKLVTSEAAHAQPPSKIGLPVGGEMSVQLGLESLVVKSANDVAIMLAEAVGGSEPAFVERMNATALRLGMTNTHFVNANGLPAAGQATTARDLAKLAMAVTRDFPDYRYLWGLAEFRIGKRRIATHNNLLKTYDGADGLKTGFICDSGYNIVASATRDGRQLMAVVLGEPSSQERAQRASNLLDHGFATYDWKVLFGTTTLDTLPVSENPRPLTSVRDTVTSWSCGRRPARVVKKGGRKPVAKARASTAAAPSAARTQ
ncbi:MAG TPA: D-alanyl-D-alanine carboxypeptidase family protein [Hyphomicrobiaceae bacterium]|jgi:D-alanyl-D-alanine carboxypeptidase